MGLEILSPPALSGLQKGETNGLHDADPIGRVCEVGDCYWKNAPQITSLDDLSGKEIYVNPVTLSYKLLKEQGRKLKQAGKAEISVNPIPTSRTKTCWK